MNSDPFLIVKEEVLKSLKSSHHLFKQWHSERRLNTPDVSDATKQKLDKILLSIQFDLEDMEETVTIVEKNRSKFQLSNEQIFGRRQFLGKSKAQLDKIRAFLLHPDSNNNDNKLSMELDEDSEALTNIDLEDMKSSGDDIRFSKININSSNTNTNVSAKNNTHANQTVHYVASSESVEGGGGAISLNAQQQKAMQQQDERLGQIGESVSQLKHTAQAIGEELDDQQALLGEFGQEMERVQSRMEHSMQRMARLLNISSDRRQWITIGVLLVMILVLSLLLILL